MTRRALSIGFMGALAAATMAIAPSAAGAQYYRGGGGYDRPAPGYGEGYSREGYDGGRGGDERGYEGRHHRCRDSGTSGTIIGAIAGGLLGNSLAGYGDRTAGTIIGGGAGALAGRAIDRDC